MLIYNHPSGRLGNAAFRYIASIVFGSIYNIQFTITDKLPSNSITINDEYFVDWLAKAKSNQPPQIDITKNYIFVGYFQHDYSHFKELIKTYIENHPDDKLWTDGNTSNTNEYSYPATFYTASQLISNNLTTHISQYDIVVHLRLEDSIEGNRTMDPKTIIRIIDDLHPNPNTKICFVVNTPKTQIEHQYINSLRQLYENTIVESNDPITDYHIMKNAKILITSLSTLSWVAALMSDSIKQLYFPNVKSHRNLICESIQTPIRNTIIYDYNILQF